MPLVYDEGLSGTEAARVLGLSPKAIERLLTRGRAFLRTRLRARVDLQETSAMMTLSQFHSLLDAYGSESRRWPRELREDAQALLRVSTDARALAGETRALDAAIAAASAKEDAAWCSAPDEALSRLRTRVAARIAALPRPAVRPPAWRFVSPIDVPPWPRLIGLGSQPEPSCWSWPDSGSAPPTRALTRPLPIPTRC